MKDPKLIFPGRTSRARSRGDLSGLCGDLLAVSRTDFIGVGQLLPPAEWRGGRFVLRHERADPAERADLALALLERLVSRA